jgi:large subunit ribosomal protein L10
MAITKGKKVEILSKLEGIVKDASTLVFVGFKGLSVSDTTKMRRALREKSVGYIVAKKTLMKRAFDAMGYQGTLPELGGEVALAWSKDEIAPAQGVREFEKQFKDKLSILGGVFGGAYKSKAEMTEIASIPALPVLRGMFAQLINSPRQRFAVVLSKVAETKTS